VIRAQAYYQHESHVLAVWHTCCSLYEAAQWGFVQATVAGVGMAIERRCWLARCFFLRQLRELLRL
jgi:hypothetical protein